MIIRNKRVFLSGPMSGYDYYNAPEFTRAHAICKEAGAFSVFNPAEEWLNGDETKSHEYYLRTCVHELTRELPMDYNPVYDVVVQLPGWENSEGAKTEAIVASACGIPCVALEDVE